MLKAVEALFQPPLLLRFGTGRQQGGARGSDFAIVAEAGGTSGLRMPVVMVAPQAVARQEAVLD